MYRLFETIRIENGLPRNLYYHQRRMTDAGKALFGGVVYPDLQEIIRVPEEAASGLFKCRIFYSDQIGEITYEKYHRKFIGSLKLVNGDGTDYPHKYTDRSAIKFLFNLREMCDDILIVKNGLITDSSFANVVFESGENLLTPEKPLLAGTMRQKLINEKVIQPAEIRMADVYKFDRVFLINAMNSLTDGLTVPTDRIIG